MRYPGLVPRKNEKGWLASDASLRRVPLSQLAEKPPREPHHPEDTPEVLQQLAQQLPEPAS